MYSYDISHALNASAECIQGYSLYLHRCIMCVYLSIYIFIKHYKRKIGRTPKSYIYINKCIKHKKTGNKFLQVFFVTHNPPPPPPKKKIIIIF